MRPPPNPALLRALGDEVRSRRLAGSLSQEALAAAAQVDRTTIARIELAKVHSSVSVFVALADALNIDPAALLSGALVRYKKEMRAASRVRSLLS